MQRFVHDANPSQGEFLANPSQGEFLANPSQGEFLANSNPTELVSVVTGLLHYVLLCQLFPLKNGSKCKF
jgi:hypothetical protein